ncbi:MAG: hypothetical protein LBS19_07265, partial [Clostridiales bacterium]|nr:hypothetical protein [Clostridiales bacterium]
INNSLNHPAIESSSPDIAHHHLKGHFYISCNISPLAHHLYLSIEMPFAAKAAVMKSSQRRLKRY